MLKKIFFTIVIAALLLSFISGGFVVSKFEDDYPNDNEAKYMLILGAKVRAEGISPTLQRRLDKALNILLLDTTITVIVSGGKGADEPISEAKAMNDYLVSHGVKSNRIIQEDQSFSTSENLVNSRKKIPAASGMVIPIYLATSNYHQYRAQYLARQIGFAPFGLACSTPLDDVPIRTAREIIAVIDVWMNDLF